MEALPYQSAPDLPERLTVWEQRTGITLNDGQRRAVRAAVTEGVTVVTGGPGRARRPSSAASFRSWTNRTRCCSPRPPGARPSA